MDGRVLGDVPSEGGEGSRRLGLYSAYSPDPKTYSISRIRLVFVLCIVIVVTFAVIFPMVQYASRSRKHLQSLPYPEIANISLSDESVSRTPIQNCSSNVFSFGFDCTESPKVEVVSEITLPEDAVVSYDVKNLEETSEGARYEEDTTDIQMDAAEVADVKVDRMGRSRWPEGSTPYPFYSLPKPTSASADDRNGFELPQQTNIFAIPADMSTDSFSDHPRPRINFTPPPYAFTPFPNFTDSYAQLSPYKVPKNYTNFEEILKFLKSKDDSKDENTERILTNRQTTMKVAGTYVMPLDKRRPGEIILPSSENYDEARPFFNGQAYVTDPFLKFRPSNPSEINRLIPMKSGVDVGPRFRKPVSFLPSSSLPADMFAPVPSLDDLSTAGSHTVAIFHPPPPLTDQRPTAPPPQDKPLSVTLDIYPVTVESGPSEAASVPSSTPGRVRGRLDPKWRPKTTERPRWRPQAPRRPPQLGGTKAPDNHMIVHLNLFPNKRKQYTYPRRGRQESTTPSDQKTTLLSGGQFNTRSDQETSSEDYTEDVDTRGTTDSTSSTVAGSSPQPEYSALGGFWVEEVLTTTPGVNRNNGSRDFGETTHNNGSRDFGETTHNNGSRDFGGNTFNNTVDGRYSESYEEEEDENGDTVIEVEENIFSEESLQGKEEEMNVTESIEDENVAGVTMVVTETGSDTIERIEENDTEGFVA